MMKLAVRFGISGIGPAPEKRQSRPPESLGVGKSDVRGTRYCMHGRMEDTKDLAGSRIDGPVLC